MNTPTAPSPETIRRAAVFWEQAQEDIKAAKSARNSGEHLQSGFFSLQAAINALSAVCHLQGHYRLPPSVDELLRLCVTADPLFAKMIGDSEGLVQVAERNPFTPGGSPADDAAESKRCLQEAKTVLRAVRAYLKKNRGRFFPP